MRARRKPQDFPLFRRVRFLAFFVYALFSVPALASTPSDIPEISVLTFGPGDDVFDHFGHTAILVEFPEAERNVLYNFGTFQIESPTLINDFLSKKLVYWLSVSTRERALYTYSAANRTIFQQELALSVPQKRRLLATLEKNALPENREYAYDYYLDNCATRVRDVLDTVLEGQLRSRTGSEQCGSYRDDTLRFASGTTALYWALNLSMSGWIDKPVTCWEGMFAPDNLRETLRTIDVADGDSAHALVASEKVLFRADRPPMPTQRPSRVIGSLGGLGVLAGAALVGAAWHARSGSRAMRQLFCGVAVVVAAVFGAVGAIFAWFWVCTDHVATHRNENLLQCPPWALLLAVLVALAPRFEWAQRVARRVAWCTAGASAAGITLKALPNFQQDNLEVVALAMPLWAGVAIGCQLAWPSKRSENVL